MWFIVVLSSLLAFGDAAFVNSLGKCGMSDSKCQEKLVESALKTIGKTGVEELGIPPIDPLHLTNVSVSLLELLDISLVDGVVKGVKDCSVHDVLSDIPNGLYSLQLTCDITIKGHYKAYSSSPLIKSLLGGDFVRGDGIGKVQVEKITVRIDFVPIVFKNKAGEVFITTNINETKCNFDIAGNLRFSADNIYLGEVDVSEVVTAFLNQNAKTLAPFFGKPFIDKSLDILYLIGNKFFEFVPAKYYIEEDLTPYVTVMKESSL